jgi:hypothetical protein
VRSVLYILYGVQVPHIPRANLLECEPFFSVPQVQIQVEFYIINMACPSPESPDYSHMILFLLSAPLVTFRPTSPAKTFLTGSRITHLSKQPIPSARSSSPSTTPLRYNSVSPQRPVSAACITSIPIRCCMQARSSFPPLLHHVVPFQLVRMLFFPAPHMHMHLLLVMLLGRASGRQLLPEIVFKVKV